MMQRKSVLSVESRDKNGNTSAANGTNPNGTSAANGTNPNGTSTSTSRMNMDGTTTTRRKRRKKATSTSSSFCSGVAATEILILVAIGSFIMVCGILVGGRLFDALGDRFSGYDTGGGISRRGRHDAAGAYHPDALHPHDEEDNQIPFNKIYHAPDAHDSAGDRSDRYAVLRQAIDKALPPDAERSLKRVQELQTELATYTAHPMDDAAQVAYDIMNCPDTPPVGYPYAWNMVELLTAWPPDDPTPRPTIYQGLCVFDFQKDYDKAMTYRTAEVPFVTVNDPSVAATAERWNTPGYMEQLLGDEEHRCEFSENNHFMYFTPVSKKNRRNPNTLRGKKIPEGWTAPTQKMWLPYTDWLNHANVTDDKLGPDKPHWYFRLIGCGIGMGNDGHCDRSSSEYLFDELPFFQPKADLLYMVDHEAQMGIHCRFGMKGVIAENHFDGSRNSIAVFGGSRRYILSHPNECSKLALYPKGHPSGRHSAIDWSHPDTEQYPEFATAKGNEIVLQPGQVLYLPTEWFHFIVSLELNMQCNTRSGINNEYHDAIHACGF
jgi:hypothetical protein